MPDYQEFGKQIKRKTGIDLSLYKEAQMRRRLTSLYGKRGYSSFSTYLAELHVNSTLFQEFLECLTINVTEFYRNKNYWNEFEQSILPQVKGVNGNLTIWSAGCSTGEEAFTIAYISKSYLTSYQVSIMATDLDEKILHKAKQAYYSEGSVVDVSDVMKNELFERHDHLYRVKELYRKMVTFKQHNLLNDPFIKDCDVIICRNVLIYFTDIAKDSIFQEFSSSLRTGGILFLGSTEQIFNPEQYGLEKIGSFFYRRK